MNNSQLKLAQFAITVYDEAIQYEIGICVKLGPEHFRLGLAFPDGSQQITTIPYEEITSSAIDPLVMAETTMKIIYEKYKGY